ncbi:MAG: purine-nucleoside phosphorylase [Thermocladium sp.]
MSPIHIKAKRGNIADSVIMAGDPARVKRLADLLTHPRVVNKNRGFLVITGSRGGINVTLAAHGVGAPSASIVMEELIQLGARNFVRLGTVGGILTEPGEYLLARGASYLPGGLYEQYLGRVAYPASPDAALFLALARSMEKQGLRYREGIVFSSDAFYAENRLSIDLGGLGIAGVEMECGALLTIAGIRGVRAACLLITSNKLGGRFLPSSAINESAIRAGEAIMDAFREL